MASESKPGTAAGILIDGISRIRQTSVAAARGLTQAQLEYRLDDEANTIAWLLWHLARGQDIQVANAGGLEQVWVTGGWAARFNLPFDDTDTGYAHTPDEVAAVQGLETDVYTDYIEAVCDQSVDYLSWLTDDDLDKVIDTRWDPPVTLAARIVSVISDDLQHAGQAAYIRGLVQRAGV